MKYMLLIYHDEPSWDAITEAERQQVYLEYRKLREELTGARSVCDRLTVATDRNRDECARARR